MLFFNIVISKNFSSDVKDLKETESLEITEEIENVESEEISKSSTSSQSNISYINSDNDKGDIIGETNNSTPTKDARSKTSFNLDDYKFEHISAENISTEKKLDKKQQPGGEIVRDDFEIENDQKPAAGDITNLTDKVQENVLNEVVGETGDEVTPKTGDEALVESGNPLDFLLNKKNLQLSLGEQEKDAAQVPVRERDFNKSDEVKLLKSNSSRSSVSEDISSVIDELLSEVSDDEQGKSGESRDDIPAGNASLG